jgi:hypothetical protein
MIEHMDRIQDMAAQVLNNPRTMKSSIWLMVNLVYEGFERKRTG